MEVDRTVITYDDCGCFYDHVRPGANPDGTPQAPRVPLVIVSPYARASYTDTTPTTFAGILAFTEHTFGLAPLNGNDRSAYDFSNAFNFAQAPLRPVHMVVSPLPPSARHIHLNPRHAQRPDLTSCGWVNPAAGPCVMFQGYSRAAATRWPSSDGHKSREISR